MPPPTERIPVLVIVEDETSENALVTRNLVSVHTGKDVGILCSGDRAHEEEPTVEVVVVLDLLSVASLIVAREKVMPARAPVQTIEKVGVKVHHLAELRDHPRREGGLLAMVARAGLRIRAVDGDKSTARAQATVGRAHIVGVDNEAVPRSHDHSAVVLHISSVPWHTARERRHCEAVRLFVLLHALCQW